MWLFRRPAVITVLAGLVVHAGVLGVARWRTGRIDSYAFASLDAGEYFRLAQNLATHGAFSQSDELPLAPDTWRTPGYPLVLAGLMLATGDSPTALVAVQQIFSILNLWSLGKPSG